jgi:hypothetical protein
VPDHEPPRSQMPNLTAPSSSTRPQVSGCDRVIGTHRSKAEPSAPLRRSGVQRQLVGDIDVRVSGHPAQHAKRCRPVVTTPDFGDEQGTVNASIEVRVDSAALPTPDEGVALASA